MSLYMYCSSHGREEIREHMSVYSEGHTRFVFSMYRRADVEPRQF